MEIPIPSVESAWMVEGMELLFCHSHAKAMSIALYSAVLLVRSVTSSGKALEETTYSSWKHLLTSSASITMADAALPFLQLPSVLIWKWTMFVRSKRRELVMLSAKEENG